MEVKLKLKGKVYETESTDFSIEVDREFTNGRIIEEREACTVSHSSLIDVTVLTLGVYVDSKCEIECLAKEGKPIKCEVAVIEKESVSTFKFKKAELHLEMIEYDLGMTKVKIMIKTRRSVGTRSIAKDWWM